MANQRTEVIPFRRGATLTVAEQEIVELAFDFWLDGFCRRYASPKDDFLRAWQEVRTSARARKGGAELFLVPRRNW